LPVLKCKKKAVACEITVWRRKRGNKYWRELLILTAAVLLSHDTVKCSQLRREETCDKRQEMGPMWLLNFLFYAFKRLNVKLSICTRKSYPGYTLAAAVKGCGIRALSSIETLVGLGMCGIPGIQWGRLHGG